MQLEKIGVKQHDDASIVVDAMQGTTVDNVFAVGDVAGKALLTPVCVTGQLVVCLFR